MSMAFAVLSYILWKVSDDSAPDWTIQGRIQNYIWGFSIWSNYRTYPMYSESQVRAKQCKSRADAASDQGPHYLPFIQQFYTHSYWQSKVEGGEPNWNPQNPSESVLRLTPLFLKFYIIFPMYRKDISESCHRKRRLQTYANRSIAMSDKMIKKKKKKNKKKKALIIYSTW